MRLKVRGLAGGGLTFDAGGAIAPFSPLVRTPLHGTAICQSPFISFRSIYLDLLKKNSRASAKLNFLVHFAFNERVWRQA